MKKCWLLPRLFLSLTLYFTDSCELYVCLCDGHFAWHGWMCFDVCVRWKQEWGKCWFTMESESICLYLLCKSFAQKKYTQAVLLNIAHKIWSEGLIIYKNTPDIDLSLLISPCIGSGNSGHTTASAYSRNREWHNGIHSCWNLDDKTCWDLWYS